MDDELDEMWRFKRALQRLERRREEADRHLRRLVAGIRDCKPSAEALAELARARKLVRALAERDRLLRLRAMTEELGEGD